MNSFKSYILLLLAASTFTACSDYLDSEPYTELTDENFYQTPEDAYDALVGCYDGLQHIWKDDIALPLGAEILSDNAFGGFGNSDGYGYQVIDEFDKDRSAIEQNLYEENWKGYYFAIYRCNVLLSKMDQIDWEGAETLRNTYEAETRFIRAYAYFDMVRLWGNIPLLTEPSTENLPQADPAEVYAVIAEDLVFAAENLAAQPYSDYTPGRVTKWAAESLLARAYLYYTGYYGAADLAGVVTKAQALAYLEDVIANSGHALVDEFANLWPAASVDDYVGENNEETVFAIKYTYTSDYDGNVDGNYFVVMFGMREQSSYPYGNGWGGATINPNLWNAYDETDTRRVATAISIDDENIEFENLAKQREYTGYYNKKYSPMIYENGTSVADSLSGGNGFQITQFQDYVSIRYADVLLMAAELGSAQAQTYYDAVRERAFQENFVSKTVSQANLMDERRFEFAGEGIRYWDLLRQGVTVAANSIAETRVLLNGGSAVTKNITAENIQTTLGLQQIPYNQITLSNGVLIQNQGW